MEQATPTAASARSAATVSTVTPAPSGFDAEAQFRGKTVRIVANASPGGGTDIQGRVVAAFMQRCIPGNPRIVFTNQPNKPLEYVFAATQAPKDGAYISWTTTPQLHPLPPPDMTWLEEWLDRNREIVYYLFKSVGFYMDYVWIVLSTGRYE